MDHIFPFNYHNVQLPEVIKPFEYGFGGKGAPA